MPQAQQPLSRQTLLAVRLVSLSYICGLPGRGNPAGAISQGCIWLHLGNPDALCYGRSNEPRDRRRAT